MTVSGLNLVSSSNNTAGTSFTTSSISPTANSLVLLSFLVRNAVSVDPVTPTVTGAGLTWVEVNSSLYDPDSSTRRKLFVFRALGASPSTGALTIDFGAVTHANITYAIDEFSGVDTSGTNGSGAIVQSGHNEVTDGTVSTLTVTLSAFSNLGNATFGAFAANNDSNTTTAGTGFTKLGDVLDSGRLMTEFRSDNDTTVNFTLSTTSDLGGVAVEIKPAPLTTSWTVSAQIKADNTKVSGASDLTNFPVLIKDGNIPASVYSAMQSAGQDLRITTDSAGTTEIPFEIVSITPASGLAEVWAKIPTLTTATDTSIYLWSGNSSAIAYAANAPFGSQAVWTDYKVVSHLEGSSFDDTSNANAGTDTAITYSSGNGKFNQGAGFNGTTSKIVLTSEQTSTTGSFSLWFKTSTAGTLQFYSQGKSSGGDTDRIQLELAVGCVELLVVQSSAVVLNVKTNSTFNDGNFHLATYVVGASSNTIYVDGTAQAVTYSTGTSATSKWFGTISASTDTKDIGVLNIVGAFYNYFNGAMDDIRISNTTPTSDWIATEYANQNSPSTFWSEVVASSVRHLSLLGCGT